MQLNIPQRLFDYFSCTVFPEMNLKVSFRLIIWNPLLLHYKGIIQVKILVEDAAWYRRKQRMPMEINMVQLINLLRICECNLWASFIPRLGSELHFNDPQATPANAINTAVMFQKEWTCEVISNGNQTPNICCVCFCVWVRGYESLVKSPRATGYGRVGSGSWHISNKFTFLWTVLSAQRQSKLHSFERLYFQMHLYALKCLFSVTKVFLYFSDDGSWRL